MTDVSAVLNLHAEGLTAHSSLVSLVRAKAAADALGVSVELLVVADRPTDATRRYLATAESLGATCMVVDVHDFGLRRNLAVEAAHGAYVAFLDGGDICSDNWLFRAFEEAEQDPRDVIWHPEANFYFGGASEPLWRLQPDTDLEADAWLRLALGNSWTSLIFARRALLAKAPYRQEGELEDWAWNADVIGRGMTHKVVPGTVHLLRRNAESTAVGGPGAGHLMSSADLYIRRAAVAGR